MKETFKIFYAVVSSDHLKGDNLQISHKRFPSLQKKLKALPLISKITQNFYFFH